MAIEFRCASCQQLLKVPDDSAGKNARCPKCSSLVVVPGASSAGSTAGMSAPLPSASQPIASPPAFPAPPPPPPPKPPGNTPSWQFGDAGQPAGGTGNPFSSGSGAASNPYAASATVWQPQSAASYGIGEIRPQRVGVDPIFSHAWRVWQDNIGLLAGTTFVALLISAPIDFFTGFVEAMLRENGDNGLAVLVNLGGSVLSFLVDTFLGIGQAIIAIKLARGQRAEFGDLFSGTNQYLPVLLGSLLAGLVGGIAFLACIVPGVILCLMFWPFYYLLVDQKASLTDSFGLASKITEGNWGTAFLLALLGLVIGFVGVLACLIGVIFAIPLITLLWATAYLMMSGQLATFPGQNPQKLAPTFAPPGGSPFAGK
jgi:DNA-directed RNA polymerase subunit RPC12/RpoP